MKSERLKKLEAELADLEQWLKLGLVPKKEITKHQEEIVQIKKRIQDEKERLAFIKESGDAEEFIPPKRVPGKQAYAEPQTLPEMNIGSNQEVTMDMETETFDNETSSGEETKYKEEATVIEDLEEDPFSDKNRWKRGILEDPDADIW
jgi:hypothetical protein